MVKSASTKLVREMMGGSRTSITPWANTSSLHRGSVEADRHSNIRALMSIMPWASWQQDAQWSRWHIAMIFQSKQFKKHSSWQHERSIGRGAGWPGGHDCPR